MYGEAAADDDEDDVVVDTAEARGRAGHAYTDALGVA